MAQRGVWDLTLILRPRLPRPLRIEGKSVGVKRVGEHVEVEAALGSIRRDASINSEHHERRLAIISSRGLALVFGAIVMAIVAVVGVVVVFVSQMQHQL